MFNNILNENNDYDDDLDILDEAINETEDSDEVIVEQIKFSNGVVFTPEELEVMDPALKAKLLKVKGDEAQMQKGFNEKLRKLKEAQTAKPATPAPKAETQQSNEDPYVKRFVYGQIVDKNFNEAKQAAEIKYGTETIRLLLNKPESANFISEVKAKSSVHFDFNEWFTNAFSNAIVSDNDIFNSFNVFKGAKSEEQLKQEAEEQARLNLIKQKNSQNTSGLPSGGNPVIKPPVKQEAPNSWKSVREKTREMLEAAGFGNK